MAQLNSRGTLTRSRWDYFEQSNGWASVFGSVPSGGIGAYFGNNSSGAIALDVYALYFYASAPSPWTIALFAPPLVLSPITPTEIEIHPLQPDRAALAGVCGMYSASTSPYFTIQRISNSMSQGSLDPITGSPFITLPPGWAIGVGGNYTSGPVELALNVWYQEVLDNVVPAR